MFILKNKGIIPFIGISLAFSIVISCGANYTSIYRDYSVVDIKPDGAPDATKTVLIDAKQRAILSNPQFYPDSLGQGDYTYRGTVICAEPSPDALSAVASTLSGSFGAFSGGKEAKGALAAAVQEAVAELGFRNATIQLLRDGLYRQCEAYMNRMIDRTKYHSISKKYINAMVTLLAIEQITTEKQTERVEIKGNKDLKSETIISFTPTQEATNASKTTEKEISKKKNIDEIDSEDTKKEETESDEESKSEKTEIAEKDASITGKKESAQIKAQAQSGSPALKINMPRSGNKQIPNHVSKAATEIVSKYYEKDTLDTAFDFCSIYLNENYTIRKMTPTMDDPIVAQCTELIYGITKR